MRVRRRFANCIFCLACGETDGRIRECEGARLTVAATYMQRWMGPQFTLGVRPQNTLAAIKIQIPHKKEQYLRANQVHHHWTLAPFPQLGTASRVTGAFEIGSLGGAEEAVGADFGKAALELV